MPRKLLVQYECDRCTREWFKDYKEGEDPPPAPSLYLKLDEVAGGSEVIVKFDSLCESCRKTVKGYIEHISKKIKGKSPERKKSKAKKNADDKSSPASSPSPVSSVASPSRAREE